MSVAYDFSGVYNSLSDDAVRALDALGINSADANSLSKLSFEGVMGQLLKMTGESFSHPMKGLVTIIAVLILCAMLSAYKSSLSGDISETVQTAASLCLSCAAAAPARRDRPLRTVPRRSQRCCCTAARPGAGRLWQGIGRALGIRCVGITATT